MKTLLGILIMAFCISATGYAVTDTTRTKTKKAKKTEQVKILLSPVEEKRFKAGNLGDAESTSTPLYSSAEQLIFSEQVRQTKKINWYLFATRLISLRGRPKVGAFFWLKKLLRCKLFKLCKSSCGHFDPLLLFSLPDFFRVDVEDPFSDSSDLAWGSSKISAWTFFWWR